MISVVTAIWSPDGWDPQRAWLAEMLAAGEIDDVTVVQVMPGVAPELPSGLWRSVGAKGTGPTTYSIWNNQVIPAVAGEYVLHLNGDIFPVPGSVPLMQTWLEAHSEAAMIGGDYWFGEVGSLAEATPRCDEILTVQEAGLMMSQYGLFRRDLWDRVRFEEGGPFGSLGWGEEDNDLGCQIRALGQSIWMIQDVRCGDQTGQMYYAHSGVSESRQQAVTGVHGSCDRLTAMGIDVAATRKDRWSYVNEKWATSPDGRPWDWEREDNYIAPGRYSLRAVTEIALPKDHALHIKLHEGVYREYLLEPPELWWKKGDS